MRGLLFIVGLAFSAPLAIDVESAQDCARASDELKSAQAALASAIRSADEAGAAYHGCMQRSHHDAHACSAEKKTLDSAMLCRRAARGAYDAAVEKKRQSCH